MVESTFKYVNIISRWRLGKVLTILVLCHHWSQVSCLELLHLGCYKDFNQTDNPSIKINSAISCINACYERSDPFVAIKNKVQCYCGSITNSRALLSHCNIPCEGDIDPARPCGGKSYYSVYEKIPSYHGCYESKFQTNRSLASICHTACSDKGFIFQGVKENKHCRCIKSDQKKEKDLKYGCKAKCENITDNVECNTILRSNVFSEKFVGGINKDYANVFHCLDKIITTDGECTHSTCEEGWRGSGCAERDCSVSNGNCSIKCVDFDLLNATYSECICEGKTISGLTIFDSCIDIDECLTKDICPDFKSTICVNNIGSYECRCREGFYLFHEACTDYNECKLSTSCPSQNLECLNVLGSFVCRCKKGYAMTKTTADNCEEENKCSDRIHVCDDNLFCKLINYPAMCSSALKMVPESDSGPLLSYSFLAALCIFLFIFSCFGTIVIVKIRKYMLKKQSKNQSEYEVDVYAANRDDDD